MTKHILLILALASATAYADEQTSAAQGTLKAQGFYFGEITGQLDDQTTAAIKRFQIRNGLEVTGQLDAATLKALGQPSEPQQAAPPAAIPAPAPVKPEETPRALAPAAPQAANEGYAFVFARTPYETAPLEVQQTTVRKAQTLLSKKGFYRGEIDGTACETFQLALVDYQSANGLPRTGQLDMETLSALRLLPRTSTTPPSKVYRGIWVR